MILQPQMSRFNVNVNSKANAKPFCKVCKDAGKPESVYTNHGVKQYDRLTGTSITTCPTLLTQECRYCHQFGHTAKYCVDLKENKEKPIKNEATVLPKIKKQVETKQENNSKRQNFALLSYSDSDDSETEQEVKMLTLPTPASAPRPITTAAKPTLTGWATIAAKPAQANDKDSVINDDEKSSFITFTIANLPFKTKTTEKEERKEKEKEDFGVVPKPILKRSSAAEPFVRNVPQFVRRKPGKSWADDDSDEEVDMEVMPMPTTFEYKMRDILKGTNAFPDYDATW
jgi:hypothetical protein